MLCLQAKKQWHLPTVALLWHQTATRQWSWNKRQEKVAVRGDACCLINLKCCCVTSWRLRTSRCTRWCWTKESRRFMRFNVLIRDERFHKIHAFQCADTRREIAQDSCVSMRWYVTRDSTRFMRFNALMRDQRFHKIRGYQFFDVRRRISQDLKMSNHMINRTDVHVCWMHSSFIFVRLYSYR